MDKDIKNELKDVSYPTIKIREYLELLEGQNPILKEGMLHKEVRGLCNSCDRQQKRIRELEEKLKTQEDIGCPDCQGN